MEGGFTEKVGGDELANFGRDIGDMADGAGGGLILACLFQRPNFNTYPFIPALAISHGKIFVDSLRSP